MPMVGSIVGTRVGAKVGEHVVLVPLPVSGECHGRGHGRGGQAKTVWKWAGWSGGLRIGSRRSRDLPPEMLKQVGMTVGMVVGANVGAQVPFAELNVGAHVPFVEVTVGAQVALVEPDVGTAVGAGVSVEFVSVEFEVALRSCRRQSEARAGEVTGANDGAI